MNCCKTVIYFSPQILYYVFFSDEHKISKID